jgi:beta-glucosidase
VGFERVHLKRGEQKPVQFVLGPRELSVVDKEGHRAMRAGSYKVYLGGSQPGSGGEGSEGAFAISGEQELPK